MGIINNTIKNKKTMINLAPTAMDHLVESTSTITDAIIPLGNAAICVYSPCTSGRFIINFCADPSLVSRALFVANCTCGIAGATASGVALATSAIGIPAIGWLGSFGHEDSTN